MPDSTAARAAPKTSAIPDAPGNVVLPPASDLPNRSKPKPNPKPGSETESETGSGSGSESKTGSSSESKPKAEQPPLSPARLRRIILVLAIACGMAVANIYYAQPLLAPIAAAFGVSQGRAALIVTLTQFGYALGMLLLLPLGDLLENRALASRTLLVTALALAGAGLSPFFGLFLVMSVLVGMTSVVAQILVPFAAHLAPEHERGKVVGTVMAGLLLGILLARTVSSLVAAAWGWRTIYLISAALMIMLSITLVRMLPERRPSHASSYRQLLLSTVRIAREEPALRRRAVGQALMFGAFSSFWTSVAFELISRHQLSQVGIGVFALVGAAGAAAAPLAGLLGDRGFGHYGSGIALGLAVAAMVLADVGAGNLILLALAGVLLDLAVQSHQVFSQREIYALRSDARARVNTVFMSTVFLGGALASGISGVLHDDYGWPGATLFGAALPLIGLVLWTVFHVRQARAGARPPTGPATRSAAA